MLKTILEQEFLAEKNTSVKYIGIYELFYYLDDNQMDCKGVIVNYGDKQYLIQSKSIGFDEFDFVYFESPEDYECRKVLSSTEEPICFIRKENEDGMHPVLRFQIGTHPVLITANNDGCLTIGISHWDIDGNWMEFDNINLLNDK